MYTVEGWWVDEERKEELGGGMGDPWRESGGEGGK